jgi:DnaJ-class molecular chaperone with C-terminal Zn finger domain
MEIRRAYRELSKLYHPDTTTLSKAIATAKFQKLNEAYATLCNPDRRQSYDQKIGYSRYHLIQVPTDLNQPYSKGNRSNYSSAYLDPTDRPLSSGEVFFIISDGINFNGMFIISYCYRFNSFKWSFTTDSTPWINNTFKFLSLLAD